MKRLFSTVLCLMAFVACAEKPSFDRYQPIIDRQMFGPLPPGFDPTKSPDQVQNTSGAAEKELTKEQEKLQSAIHFSVINVDAGGTTVVGFTDNSDPKAPKHYYLKVGETRDGWEVKSADSETATMTIVKNDIEVTLKLGGNSATDASATAKAGGAAAPASAAPNAGEPRRGIFGGGLMGGSLRARRLQRRQEAQAAAAKQQEEQAAKDAERQAQAEQEKVQREAERAEQRQQLLAIQEELKRVRETKAAERKNEDAGAQNNDQ